MLSRVAKVADAALSTIPVSVRRVTGAQLLKELPSPHAQILEELRRLGPDRLRSIGAADLETHVNDTQMVTQVAKTALARWAGSPDMERILQLVIRLSRKEQGYDSIHNKAKLAREFSNQTDINVPADVIDAYGLDLLDHQGAFAFVDDTDTLWLAERTSHRGLLPPPGSWKTDSWDLSLAAKNVAAYRNDGTLGLRPREPKKLNFYSRNGDMRTVYLRSGQRYEPRILRTLGETFGDDHARPYFVQPDAPMSRMRLGNHNGIAYHDRASQELHVAWYLRDRWEVHRLATTRGEVSIVYATDEPRRAATGTQGFRLTYQDASGTHAIESSDGLTWKPTATLYSTGDVNDNRIADAFRKAVATK